MSKNPKNQWNWLKLKEKVFISSCTFISLSVMLLFVSVNVVLAGWCFPYCKVLDSLSITTILFVLKAQCWVVLDSNFFFPLLLFKDLEDICIGTWLEELLALLQLHANQFFSYRALVYLALILSISLLLKIKSFVRCL